MKKATGYGIAALVVMFFFAAEDHCFAGAPKSYDSALTSKYANQQATSFSPISYDLEKIVTAKQPKLTSDQQRIKGIFGKVYDTNRTRWDTPNIAGRDGIKSAVDIKYFDKQGKLIGVERVVNKVVEDGKNKQITFYFDPDFNIVRTDVVDIPSKPPLRPGTWDANTENRK
jgi:hypothetical protein